jgi:hypothetical protein
MFAGVISQRLLGQAVVLARLGDTCAQLLEELFIPVFMVIHGPS